MTRADTVRRIEALGAVAVLRLDDAARLRPVVDALAEGGIGALELTMTMRGALEAIAALNAVGDEILIGAGTVLDAETARLAIFAGARFVVSPTFSPALVEMCHRYDVAAIPGGFTATEILAAWQAGADLVKVFPAASLGPGYIKDLRGPLPQIRLMPTGGVSADNAGAYLAAGAVAVGVGGALVDGNAIARGDHGALTREARRLVQAIRAAREGRR
jgi:2-dehydro-3-deoxyphosphogluconate aldolase / (4S)-4-hydroxy-2-oxoglutarate aldolase